MNKIKNIFNFKDSFTSEYLKNAFDFLGCKEDPKTPNRSICVDSIKKLYQGNKQYDPDNDPWCAMFVWAMVNEACKTFDLHNPLPKTASTWNMVDRSKSAGIRVDKKPEVGSIFFFPRKGGGHVGFVTSVVGDKILTVEGNVSDKVQSGERKVRSDFQFIHIQDMNSLVKWYRNKHVIAYGTLAVAGVSLYLLKDKFKL